MSPSIVYSFILLCLMTWIKPGLFQQSTCNCNKHVDQRFADGVLLRLYKCDGTFKNIAYPITLPQPMLNHLDETKQTTIYIFGFPQHINSNATKIMIKALCDGGKDNVVVLDWGKHSQNHDYKHITFSNAQKVGPLFAECIKLLREYGLDLNKVHIVAFSVGSHIASFAGRCNNFKIPHITVLDPANPTPTENKGCYISSKCAQRVDMIHTDMNKYGANFNQLTASAHYIANKGERDQCDCPDSTNAEKLSPEDFCSHEAAIRYYAETVKNPNKYMATSCEDSSECGDGKKYRVGYGASPNAHGILHFKTDGY